MEAGWKRGGSAGARCPPPLPPLLPPLSLTPSSAWPVENTLLRVPPARLVQSVPNSERAVADSTLAQYMKMRSCGQLDPVFSSIPPSIPPSRLPATSQRCRGSNICSPSPVRSVWQSAHAFRTPDVRLLIRLWWSTRVCVVGPTSSHLGLVLALVCLLRIHLPPTVCARVYRSARRIDLLASGRMVGGRMEGGTCLPDFQFQSSPAVERK